MTSSNDDERIILSRPALKLYWQAARLFFLLFLNEREEEYVMKNKIIGALIALGLLCSPILWGSAHAAQNEIKIATISVKAIISKSKAGHEAQKALEAKMSELQSRLQKDQGKLEAMRVEIEKKGSVWSADVRAGKEREYQKQMRDFQLKSEDAQYELKQLEGKVMSPILKDLHEVIGAVGKKHGYTLILENSSKGMLSRIGLMYADESLDISETVLTALNERTAKK